MLLNRKSVELLAPAGNWEALTAAIEAGADAVYLGGKHFNMRMHRQDSNFDDETLEKAVNYAHSHDTRLYITLNNLISDEEIEPLRSYLLFLAKIKPDAILVQDLAVIELVHDMGIKIPLHASVMMNTHNEHAIKKLKEYGLTRIVVGREMTLSELCLFKERTGIEVEYFIHGDMCMAESGQCIHSGVIFGQSSNRGRCLKPCRWPYQLIDEKTGETLDADSNGPYKLALKDMCMYRNIPELIQAGVYSFKIEGRMRPAAFIKKIVATYRQAIDRYIEDPNGYSVDQAAWQDLYLNRSRDFTTAFALGKPDAQAIGFDGKREPRFFSQAIPEADLLSDVSSAEAVIQKENLPQRHLAVRVADFPSLQAACKNGADTIYIAGEAFLPHKPWKIKEIKEAIALGNNTGTKIVIMTPRTTMRRECGELEQFFTELKKLRPDGIMVSNLGTLKLAKEFTSLPVQADFSFNLFNHEAAGFLQENGLCMATASLELSYLQLKELIENSALPIEVIIHGSYESMICDHDIPGMSLPTNDLDTSEIAERHYALLDKAGEVHPIRIDQYGRNHIFFAKDLCLYQYLEKLNGVSSYRLEAHDYAPEHVARLTKIYRQVLDSLDKTGHLPQDESVFLSLKQHGPRKLGIGAYKFKISKNSI